MTTREIIIEGLLTGKDAPLEEGGLPGRGVFALSPISKGKWLCEYKGSVTPAKQTSDQHKYDKGSYRVTSTYTVGDGPRLCWDATRKFHQLGRYLNHAVDYNGRLTSPEFVRGKWRIGFVAVRDIGAGHEVVWDYGVRGEVEWGSSRLVDGNLVQPDVHDTNNKGDDCNTVSL